MLSIPNIKNNADVKELRNYVLRLASEINLALDELATESPLGTEALVKSTRALFLSEELKSLLFLKTGDGYISIGNITICFGSLTLIAGTSKAQSLPVSYKDGYSLILTPSGSSCEGVRLYSNDKQGTGFKVCSSGGSGEITVDYITVGLRTGG